MVALTLVLTLPALADGQMPTGPGIEPPPSAPAAATARGEMDTGVGATQAAGASLTGVALGLLGGVLALL